MPSTRLRMVVEVVVCVTEDRGGLKLVGQSISADRPRTICQLLGSSASLHLHGQQFLNIVNSSSLTQSLS